MRDGSARARAFLLTCCFLLAAAKDESRPAPSGRWTALRVVEKALSGTGQVVRGVGDGIAVGVGGTIRMVGDSVDSVGSGLDDLGHVVAGSGGYQEDLSALDATRGLVSKPIRLLSQAFRGAGQVVSMVGDTTERIAGGAFSLVPDTVQVVASSVKSLGDALEGDMRGGEPQATPQRGGGGSTYGGEWQRTLPLSRSVAATTGSIPGGPKRQSTPPRLARCEPKSLTTPPP